VHAYGKLDVKLNIHQLRELHSQNARMFYYASAFTQHWGHRGGSSMEFLGGLLGNRRVAGGVGVAIDVGERVSIEVLLNMFHLGKKRFDKTSDIQLRISMND
jgi:hypothetical protein